MFGSLLFLLAQITWVNLPPAGSLPKGVTHHTYFSPSMGHDVGYLIYLPPNYAKRCLLNAGESIVENPRSAVVSNRTTRNSC